MTMVVFCDSAVIALVFTAIDRSRGLDWLPANGLVLTVIVVPAYLYFGLVNQAFRTSTLKRIATSYAEALRAFIAALMFLIVCAFILKFSMQISRYSLLIAALTTCGALGLVRIAFAMFLRMVVKEGLTDRLLISDQPSPNNSQHVHELHLPATETLLDLQDPDAVNSVSEFVAKHDVVYLDCKDEAKRRAWITLAKASGIACEVVVRDQHVREAVGIGQFGHETTLILSRGPLSLGSRIKKRTFDLIIGSAILLALSPLMIVVAIIIRLESAGPALFTQQRIGQANRPFRIFKFRSMRVCQSDEHGVISTARYDQRITRFGAIIRKLSIDELPQLFNVVLGNMSLVGPRPHAKGSRAGEQLFWEVSELYWVRHALKPGITGLAQINGFRGATHHKKDLEARLRFDLEYLQTWSMWNDLVILFATIKVVSHRNAY